MSNIRKIKPPLRAPGVPPGTLYAYIDEFLYFKASTASHSTWMVYKHKLRRFQSFLVDNAVKEVGPRAVFTYLLSIKKTGKPMNAYVWSLNGFFDWCVTMGYIDSNPARAFPTPHSGRNASTEVKVFSEGDYSRLKSSSIGTEMYYAIVCGYHTGMRMGDVCMLRWSNVRFDAAPMPILVVVPGKTRRSSLASAVIPIVPELMEILRARHQFASSTESFVSDSLAILYQRDASIISKMFAKVAAKAGVNGTFHTLRRTALSRWVNSSHGEHITVQKMSGHSSPATLSRYVNPSVDKMARIMGMIQ